MVELSHKLLCFVVDRCICVCLDFCNYQMNDIVENISNIIIVMFHIFNNITQIASAWAADNVLYQHENIMFYTSIYCYR